MIFKSKELVNVPDRGEMPVWSVDTDTQTVTHVHTKTFKTEEHRFFRDYIRYHLHYSEEENPERLQRLVDNGEIFQYLSDLDNKVFDALDSQEELLKANSREFQEAHEKGDIVTEGAIGNLLQQQARESVFEAMIYV
ncbi:MAG: hypothetical protein IJ696_00020 [Ruminococcus sp.]|nr:hypothetical protein [Ruminococcus sp.]